MIQKYGFFFPLVRIFRTERIIVRILIIVALSFLFCFLICSCSQRFLPAEYSGFVAKKHVKCPDLSHYDKTIKPHKTEVTVAKLGIYCKMNKK